MNLTMVVQEVERRRVRLNKSDGGKGSGVGVFFGGVENVVRQAKRPAACGEGKPKWVFLVCLQ